VTQPRSLRRDLGTAAAAFAAVALYLAWSRAGGSLGFPLDDAWIHQTYARNLAQSGQWAFVPGQPSAGSTAPLWTLLLAVGYAVRLPFLPWGYALGALCLAATALLTARLAERFWPTPGVPFLGLLVGLAVALEWRLVWAAASGMETALFMLLAMALWYRLAGEQARRPLLTGLLGGALILTRPEGALAVGLAAVGVLLAEGLAGRWRRGALATALLVAGCGLVVGPVVALNLRLSGTPFPNTFYAKQAEYAVYLAQPLWQRLWRVGTLPLIGAPALLLPGLAWGIWREFRRADDLGRRIVRWLPLVWAVAMVGVYVLRLPVTYQHGRYLIPVIPVVILYGVGGALGGPLPRRGRRGVGGVLLKTWAAATAVVLALFVVLGARAYGTDVAIIEGEMVRTARWLEANTAPGARIAVHDIGAVGYFTRRPLLDLAGLVNPEVTPFIRDEERLLVWMEEQGADYLVTFPSWYPRIVADPRMELVYRTGAAVTVAQGGENMAVYVCHWK
jgi:hypothetical protein